LAHPLQLQLCREMLCSIKSINQNEKDQCPIEEATQSLQRYPHNWNKTTEIKQVKKFRFESTKSFYFSRRTKREIKRRNVSRLF